MEESSWQVNPQHLHDALSAMASQQRSVSSDGDDNDTRAASASASKEKHKPKRVGFTQESISPLENEPFRSRSPTETGTLPNASGVQIIRGSEATQFSEANFSGSTSSPCASPRHNLSRENLLAEVHESLGEPYLPKPKSAFKKGAPFNHIYNEKIDDVESGNEQKRLSHMQAHERAIKVSKSVGSYSAPGSRRNSWDKSAPMEHPTPRKKQSKRPDFIPLHDIFKKKRGSDDDGSDDEASNFLTRTNARSDTDRALRAFLESGDLGDIAMTPGQMTPVEVGEEYVPRPKAYRPGLLRTLVSLGQSTSDDCSASNTHEKLPRYHRPGSTHSEISYTSTAINTPQQSPPSSGSSTPKRPWYQRGYNSTTSLHSLIGASSALAAPASKEFGDEITEKLRREGHLHKRSQGGSAFEKAIKKIINPKSQSDYRIKKHLSETMNRQRYLVKLSKALMQYGAPTHRMEQYMIMSARVLEIEGSFLYIPGCLMMSFEDSAIGATEVKLVRTNQGVDLGRLRDTHEIYKEVVHDRLGVDEASARLEAVMSRKPKFNKWFLILLYGVASASVGPFAFQARFIDLPIAFLLGCIVGILQLHISPQSDIYSNVFEIVASILTSFLARAFGSIRGGMFCFSALAQSSIALILPGYMVLCASLELQSRSIISGSVRMVYAIIYSLFLGFGITIGTALYGLVDKQAPSSVNCASHMTEYWQFLPFVVVFTLCLIIINQAKWKQVPLMLVVSIAGYSVNYWTSAKWFVGNAQVSNTLGAFTIGAIANLQARVGSHVENWFIDIWEKHFSRSWHRHIRRRWNRLCTSIGLKTLTSNIGSSDYASSRPPLDGGPPPKYRRRVGYGLAAASMLPAIFVQVPSGLAVSGSLMSGIISADQITGNTTDGITTVTNASEISSTKLNNAAFTVGYSVVQVAIGCSVGLFLSVLFVYPFGKKRSGLFSF